MTFHRRRTPYSPRIPAARYTISQRLLSGAAAGSVATVVMSALMVASQRLGLMGKQPPAQIVDRALDAAGEAPTRPTRAFLTALAHLGFGAAGGALFAAGRPHPDDPVPPPVAGAGYGIGVWSVSYLGWVPAIGALPPAPRDRPGRPESMILAHVLYGAVLGALTSRWTR